MHRLWRNAPLLQRVFNLNLDIGVVLSVDLDDQTVPFIHEVGYEVRALNVQTIGMDLLIPLKELLPSVLALEYTNFGYLLKTFVAHDL